MEFGILGSLEVRDGGAALPLGAPRERSLLAILILNANELVATERLVDELWGERPPKAAVKAVQVYVSRLRKLLGAETIVTRHPGYLLRVEPARIDLHRFERLAAEGARALAAGDAETARRRLREALSLWRGAPLSDFVYEPFAQAHTAPLEELRLAALEDRIEADLRCGRSSELVGELQSLAARHPLRERLRAQLMLALYRSGRQAEALDVFREARTALVEELGVEPSREVQQLQQAILTQDPTLERPRKRTTPRAPGLFVGRESELAALLSALDEACEGRGSVFLLSGEPGIGKSRLADELVGHASERGMAVLRGRCWEAGGAPAFWPWAQPLGAYIRGAEPEELRRLLGRGAPELATLLPELRDIVGDVPPTAVRDPDALRFRQFDAVAGFLRALAARDRPLMLVLDDLHAADEPSLLLLEFLARTIADGRIMVIGAYRDTERSVAAPARPLERRLGDLLGEAAVTRIALAGLRPLDVRDYVELSGGGEPSDGLVEAIHARTAGNPLFVAETVRMLVAGGRLERTDAERVVPGGVREAIASRLRRLPEEVRTALGVASVLGNEFEPDLVERAAAAGETPSALDHAIAARLVTAAAGAPGLLSFSHALVRDVLYEALPAPRRRRLHRRFAEELERRRAVDPGPQLAKLAHHFLEAGLIQKGAGYATLAAERAASQLAYEEAARLYGIALDALGRAGAADDSRMCDLLLCLGEARARAGDEAGAKESFLRAAEAARRAGLAERLGRAALGYGGRWVWTVMRGDRRIIPLLEEALEALPKEDSALRARLLARLAGGPLKALGDASRARRFALSRDAVEMARRLDDPAVLAWALDGRKVAIWGPDTLEEHWAVIEELRELAERAGDPEQLVDARICTLIKLFERFELSRFEAEHARAARAADELGQPGQRWLVAVMRPIHALLAGRLADADELIDEAFELGREAASWNARVCSVLQRFVLRGLRGQAGESETELRLAAAENPLYPTLQAALASLYAELGAVAECQSAFDVLAGDDFAAVPTDDEWLLTMGFLSDACAFLSDTERAALLHERLEPYGHRVVVGPLEVALGSAALPLGRLAATLGRAEEAAQLYERAARENDFGGALPWAAHARLDHARLLLASGQREAAEPLLEQAARTYCQLGMEAYATRCAAAAESAAPTPARA